MPFRFKNPEHPARETERIAIEQIDRALGEIDDASLDRDVVVHQVRKRCKKLRGLLRLVRSEIGDAYQKENARFRDAARPLSGARDARVMLDTYDDLMDVFANEVDRRNFAPLRRNLTLRMKSMLAEAGEVDDRMAEFRRQMLKARDRVPGWASRVGAMSELLAGMKNTYKRGREAMETAYAKPSAEHFHEWRKHVKYHWYHCQLLEGLWPPMMQARADEIKRLEHALGRAHDLFLFHELLQAEPGLSASSERQHAVLELIGQRREMLRGDARTAGRRLFVTKPGKLRKDFERHVGTWAAAWHLAD